ncbi:MAG: NAD(P)-binding domain-containing protein [Ignisphaera sp.]|nr:NAD(P)-binding domain-containing protein [Ignisphaera sp.]MCX8168310.1 NAD(P)-binding domain-containing protein [Ignisphaera sp.]MDW8085358.1 NAD(P)-binding domain-containing protein [Ignisphaera sp.]
MKVGIIGTGIMGSNLARCLSSKGFRLGLFNRTKWRAERLASEVGGRAYDTPYELIREVEAAIAFLPDDYALMNVVHSIVSSGNYVYKGKFFINGSTVTPMASLEVMGTLERLGISYIEAPVYGSAEEARDCRLITLVACSEELFKNASILLESYSSRIFYTGKPPSAIVLKLALNNIGLAMPALLSESLMLLESWNVDVELFRRVASNLWFGAAIERIWGRIIEEQAPRFKVWMAGKDYWCIASALKEKKLPSLLSDALSSIYMVASTDGRYSNKDYPQVVNYYTKLARKAERSME